MPKRESLADQDAVELTPEEAETVILKENVKQLKAIFVEFGIIVTFIIAIIIKTFIINRTSIFYMNDIIKQLFLSEYFEVNFNTFILYQDITKTSDFWDFMQTTFVDNLYEEQSSKHFRLGQSLFLGPPRLRQIRVREGSCTIYQDFKDYFDKCYGEYNSVNEERNVEFHGSKYYTSSELRATEVKATLYKYDSGGYMVPLSFEIDKTKELISNLKKNNWLDRGTRLILIEITLFNDNIKVFDNLKFIIEIPSTSGIVTSYDFTAVPYYLGWKSRNKYFLATNIFALVMNFIRTIRTLRDFHRRGCKSYFTTPSLVNDFIVINGLWLCFAYEIWHIFYVRSLIYQFKKDPESFVSLDYLCVWYLMYQNLYAICISIMFLRLLTFFDLNASLVRFLIILRRCSLDLLGFLSLFFLIFLTYSLLGLLLFGAKSESFANFGVAMFSMLKVILNIFDYRSMNLSNEMLPFIFFTTYIVLTYFLLMNIFLAILVITFDDVKHKVSIGVLRLEHPLKPVLSNFFQNKCRCLFKNGVFCYCLRGKRISEHEKMERTDLDLLKKKDVREMTDKPLSKIEQANILADTLQAQKTKFLREKLKQLLKMVDEMIHQMDQILDIANERLSKVRKRRKREDRKHGLKR